ncbi:MAG: TRAP transporter substrate-binding protein [Vreelandella alkaliphila]|uniref:C4-dicarboxylate ABC transporter substrate-binding protein n=2 Tax=Halomonadaceae TaxID=28256 RepID=A0A060BBB1_9GAMM|nr:MULTISPECIES: TRAP transporter substrate-binding protein [Halomonas]AIA74351.1 C4-dicarboxylate ABC transporter substrate-binding protein [Halomonas campaniensis]HBP40912.1 C4-dicarboxylate ABC transporter substrate-binding protein [Halomonas sp.]AYF33482.1 C4-dicarboxylate ABC transporter substrate-binding protein [Halomonas alkaliphila]MCD6004999.1 TRAP transporter substrate-binding protein [Halomonas sp. IOP_6]MDX5977893.1 TRAP transporter substrate-binding protein [Halomonas alkaliphila
MTPTKAFLSTAVAASLLFGAVSAQARDFRLGVITPPQHLWSTEAVAFADTLHERSDGEHSVSVFPAQQLGNEAQMVQQLQTGALDMAFLTIAEISNRIPDFGALYAPYLVDDVDHAARLLRSDTAGELLDLMPQGVGMVGVGYGMVGMRQVLSRAPIENQADMSGKRLRITPFEPIRDFYTATGAAPAPLPLLEVYDALANGQVDAIDMDFDSILILKFYEQAPNLLISNHMMFPMVGVVSGRVWRELSVEDRELIETAMAEHLENVLSGFQAKDAAQEAEIRELGLNIVEADAEFFGDAIAEWEAIWGEKAPRLEMLRQEADRLRE